MTILDIKFPDNLASKARGGAEYRTAINLTAGGKEQRAANWLNSRHKYAIKFSEEDAGTIEHLINFFHLVRGKYYGFRFRDWNDCSLNCVVIGTGNGTLKDFQIIKNYTVGSYTFSRKITKPTAGTISVHLDGVIQNSGITVNYSTGIITFTTAPANGKIISMSGEFDVPCRFDSDWLDLIQDRPNTKGNCEIKIVEVVE